MGAPELTPEIYVFPATTYAGVNVIENALFTGVADWNSEAYAANVLLAACGEGTHYGLALGYANLLCERLGWGVSPASAVSIPAGPAALDLNLLCFDSSFVSESEVRSAREIACAFARYYVDSFGEGSLRDLLTSSKTQTGMEALSQALGAYYAANGVDYAPATLRIGCGGLAYAYTVQTAYGKFYIGRRWQDANYGGNPLVSENFLRENHGETKEFFECNLQQMACYQALLQLSDYDNSLAILFPNPGAGSAYSYYQSGAHRIYVYNVDSLMHEYIHALTQPSKSMPQWEVEGFARYFSYFYDSYGLASLNVDYNNAVETGETRYLFEYKASLERPIDMAIDFQELENIAVYSRGYTNPNASYVAGSSFVQYLVKTFGEEAVIQSIYGSGTPLPKTYNELVQDWNQYIRENYAGYSRYS